MMPRAAAISAHRRVLHPSHSVRARPQTISELNWVHLSNLLNRQRRSRASLLESSLHSDKRGNPGSGGNEWHAMRNPVFTKRLYAVFALVLLALTTSLTARASAGQDDSKPSQVTEGCLLYRSPTLGRFDPVPLIHTDVVLDVRGLVASATVTQQYANSSTEPIEAVYIFPLPHDTAVYDMEIRIGNRVIRSVIHEREEGKRVYEAAKSEGKRAALVEEERPNIFTTSVANIMPGDHVDVRLRYVAPLRWEAGKMRLVFPMVVGPRYIPGTQALGHAGTGWSLDTSSVSDASRITPLVRNPESRSGHDISLSVDLETGFEPASIKVFRT